MASSREFLMLVKESSLGTPMTSPVAGTDLIYIRLTDGNAFGMAAAPIHVEIPYGGGLAITADVVSDHYECKGQLKTKLYPAQAALLMAWITGRVNAGQTLPWVTTEPPGDLASVSLYHGIQRSDGTYLRKRFSGCKATGATIEVSRQATVASLSVDIQGCQQFGSAFDGTTDPTATEFPAPVDSSFPTGPYNFKQTAGFLICRGTGTAVRSKYEDLTIKVQNSVDGRWFETSFLQLNQFTGRSTTLDATLLFQATPDDRSALEAITAQTVSVGFHNGVTGQNMTITMNGRNVIKALPYDLPLDKAFTQKLSLMNVYDLAAAEDFDVAFA
jgi:hypothetical protein